MASEVHVEPADYDRHGAVCSLLKISDVLQSARNSLVGPVAIPNMTSRINKAYHRDQEKRCVLQTPVIEDTDKNSKASDTDKGSNHGECKAMPSLVRQVSHDHGESKGHSPRRHRVQLCLDRTISVAPDNARREVSVSVSRHDEAKVHETTKPDLDVLEYVQDVLASDLAFSGTLALIGSESGRDIRALFLGQPFCFLRKVGDTEEEGKADDAGEKTFEDENPAPSTIALDAFHLADGRCEKTAKGTR